MILAIGVPLIVNGGIAAVIIALMSGRMGSLEACVSSLEARMLSFENTFTARFDLLMGRLTDLEKDIHKR